MMENLTKVQLHNAIEVYYQMHKGKGKDYIIRHFWPALQKKLISKATLYRLLDKLEKDGNIKRKSGSGRPKKMSSQDLSKLKPRI